MWTCYVRRKTFFRRSRSSSTPQSCNQQHYRGCESWCSRQTDRLSFALEVKVWLTFSGFL